MTESTSITASGNATSLTRENVETILPLLPLQKALLLRRGQGDDPGRLHVQCTLHGMLDTDRLEQAWATTLAWHPALRMSTHARDEGDPLAVVWRNVHLDWNHVDLRSADPATHADAIDAIMGGRSA